MIHSASSLSALQKKHINRSTGFTIVELLIVVIVIAILATITIVGYRNITARATESSLKSELRTAGTQLSIAKTETGSYPISDSGIKKSDKITFSYTAAANTFCLQATHPNLANQPFYTTEAGAIQAGECPAVPMATTMQGLTPSQCTSLATFTGSNNAAVITLTDSRGGTTRTYQVAKLADGKCWMLNNLKLGSTTGTTVLTPADSNVATNFTLPQLTTTGVAEYDLPRAYGPVPGDTGAGATNYGYLYNWPAATAGASRTSNSASSGDAQYSICPANWRLPSGGDTGEFAMLNAKMNNATATAPSTSSDSGHYQNWQATGPFKGTFSGNWSSGSFYNQVSYSYLWSRSANASSADAAHIAGFNASAVSPGNINGNRNHGYEVRCLLN